MRVTPYALANALESLEPAVVEAGFVNARSPLFLELHGTKGTLIYGAPQTDRLYLSTEDTDGWQELPLENRRESAFEQWVGHMVNGTDDAETLCREVSGKELPLPEAGDRLVALLNR